MSISYLFVSNFQASSQNGFSRQPNGNTSNPRRRTHLHTFCYLCREGFCGWLWPSGACVSAVGVKSIPFLIIQKSSNRRWPRPRWPWVWIPSPWRRPSWISSAGREQTTPARKLSSKTVSAAPPPPPAPHPKVCVVSSDASNALLSNALL